MDLVFWLLRIIHIVGGVFWVGGSLVMTLFIAPTVGAMGEAGPKFMTHLVEKQKFSNRMAIASGATLLAGFLLYGLDARAGAAWMRSSFAIGLGIGAAFAIVGFVLGMMLGRNIKAMAQLAGQMQAPPSASQRSEMQTLQKRQATYSMVSTWALVLATVFMAIARYL